ncbi:hypothetical protein MD484_g5745, partial [Candolleomyces efflorescens]
MPRVRPGWSPKQSVYLRIAAIELLRVMLAGNNPVQYLDEFFEEWLVTYAAPAAQEGFTPEATTALYKERVIDTIKWHAFRGSAKTSRKARIHKLKLSLQRDLYYLWDLPEDHPKPVDQANSAFQPGSEQEPHLVV